MKRSAFAFTLFVLVASCGKKAPPPAATSNDVAEERGGDPGMPAAVTDGALWTCQIEDYDPQPCKFHQEDDGWHLTKLMGSQRFTGTAGFEPGKLAVVGEFFCPWGDCTEPVDSSLTADEGGAYTGDVAGSPVKVWWDEDLAGEWGGAGYGNRTGREVE